MNPPFLGAGDPTAPLLEMKQIVKSFDGTHALKSVDFNAYNGEIHALMGENGAGKSTLIKVMTGVYQPDAGQILLNGTPIRPGSPKEATSLGISTVYQEVNLAPNLSVEENVVLGREPRNAFGIRWKQVADRAAAALDRLSLKIDQKAPLGSLPVALQQMVAIARALDTDASVLVLDEPTSSLDQAEVDQLFQSMQGLKSEGLAIVFVTHFLDQVYAVSDRITVLRNGQKVAESPIDQMERRQLVETMVGREVDEAAHRPLTTRTEADPLIATDHVAKKHKINKLSIDVRPGETLGIAGLLGSGRTESIDLLFGLERPDSGTLTFAGKPVTRWNHHQAISQGVALCPEDRKSAGILPDLSVRENLLIVLQSKRGWYRPLSRARQIELCDKMVADLRIATSDIEKPVRFLSGGNQQKVVLARWILSNPRLLLLDEPTRGIDIGAKQEIMRLIERLRAEGLACVFVSSELSETVRVSTRVAVLRDRQHVTTLEPDHVSEDAILEHMAGHH